MKMRVERHTVRSACQEEIEHAIDNVGRTKLDRWMRRQWHKAGARDRWSEGRKAKWVEWKRHPSSGVFRGGGHQPDRGSVAHSKVWVKGHVSCEFLDWAERYWSHDDETRAMLRGCCFEVWER
ncbi:MAG: hypothetical protein ISS72_06980 [Candidatus Brocadiae bacterium]|nr:hypothetical protein [Candidatus Brocadiia bacterium]